MSVHRVGNVRLDPGRRRTVRGARAAAAVVLTVGFLAAAPPAVAQVDAVLALDDGTVMMTVTDTGGVSGTISVTNVSQDPLTIRLVGQGDVASCVFEADSGDVPSARTVEVTFTAEACTLPDNGAQAVVVLDGAVPDEVPVILKVDRTHAVDLSWIPVTFVIALALAAVTVLFVARHRPVVDLPDQPDPAADAKPQVRAPWDHQLHGLGVDWQLSSWASNVTVVATTFAAFLGATDVLTAVLGAEPKAAVAQILVGGALALVLLGVAPVLLRLIGPSETPTVAGLLLAAVATLTGAVGQILVIAWAVTDAGLPTSLSVIVWCLTIALVFLLLYYGYRTLLFRLAKGVAAPPTALAPETFIAAAILLPLVQPDFTRATWHADLYGIVRSIARTPEAETDYPSEAYMGRRRRTSEGDDYVTGVL